LAVGCFSCVFKRLFCHLNTQFNSHVRLKKNFVNREVVPHVGTKLRIPEVLLVEKLRTQQRFNVSRAAVWAFSSSLALMNLNIKGR